MTWEMRLQPWTFLARDTSGNARPVVFYAKSCSDALAVAQAWAGRTGHTIEELPENREEAAS